MSEGAKIHAVIVAAGRGVRAGGGRPKQYRVLCGEPVLARSMRPFLDHEGIEKVLVVINPDDRSVYSAVAPDHPKLLAPVGGGDTRSESVLNGLRSLKDDAPDAVLVHDAARPFVTKDVISRVIAALTQADGVVPAQPAVDAMREVTEDGILSAPVSRTGVHKVQTPQGFNFDMILQAIETADDSGTLSMFLDEAEAGMEAGMTIVSVEGDPVNFKLTGPEDFAMAERLISPAMRVGQGFDVHALVEGTSITLCGITIPHTRSLKGHSDADVGLHAITDALFGAIASGDIGQHFPPSDPQWQGVDSAVFLRRAVALLAEAGYGIGNMDVTLICEHPKIGPHAAAMRARVAAICEIDIGLVSIKATTTERLGFCGRGEGIAAQAIVTILRKP